jgi:hypothetical protein
MGSQIAGNETFAKQLLAIKKEAIGSTLGALKLGRINIDKPALPLAGKRAIESRISSMERET